MLVVVEGLDPLPITCEEAAHCRVVPGREREVTPKLTWQLDPLGAVERREQIRVEIVFSRSRELPAVEERAVEDGDGGSVAGVAHTSATGAERRTGSHLVSGRRASMLEGRGHAPERLVDGCADDRRPAVEETEDARHR
jgi:hypothetical protein